MSFIEIIDQVRELLQRRERVTYRVLIALRLDTKQQTAPGAVRDQLATQFDIDRIVVFGSYAWGKPDDESDIDLLVVLKHSFDLETEDRISEVIFEINLEYDVNLSELIVDRQTWGEGLASAMPIHERIENRGVIL
jgi:predicted nucleotidyltransferase